MLEKNVSLVTDRNKGTINYITVISCTSTGIAQEVLHFLLERYIKKEPRNNHQCSKEEEIIIGTFCI